MSELFDQCLYFRLNRILHKLTIRADDAFARHGLSSSHAYLMILLNNKPKIGTVELSKELNLNPSTITRLADKMVAQGYLSRQKFGKRCEISCTKEGKKLALELEKSWQEFQQCNREHLGNEIYEGLNAELKKMEANCVVVSG
ncbi:MAG: MarR family winged helix-turn-helix transcriptional regulator [Mangrovibacterium sp.]